MATNYSSAEESANQPIADREEKIEGLQSRGEGLGDYPIDELLIRHETRTVHDVLRRIEEKRYIMDPDFQRDFVWDTEKQSRLIESVLMRIPLPVFYLAEDDQGRMIVVDGLQRISTFHRFRDNRLKLKLPKNEELNDQTFDDLLPKHQNRIEDFNLIFYIVDPKAPDRARLDIFERVNSGEPLSRQQMRNALYSGSATKFLKEESESQIFKQATGGSLNKKTMRDREFVNRFCSFYMLGVDAYKDDMDEFLAEGLKGMNNMGIKDLEDLSKVFRQSLINNFKIFDKHSFRKSIANDDGRRSVLNASLWDVMSTELAKHTPEIVTANKEAIKGTIISLLKNEEFVDTITLATGDARKIRTRFQLTRSALKEALSC